MHETSSRRDTVDLFVVQALTTGLTLPVLSMFSLRLWPPGLPFRAVPTTPPVASLGLPVPEDAVTAATRQAEGLAFLAGLALLVALMTLVVGCATAASLVRRSALARREELGLRAAVGATKGELVALVVGPLARRLAVGALAGTVFGLVLLAVVRGASPMALVLPAFPLSVMSLVAVFAPMWAAWTAIRTDIRVVLRLFASPLTIKSATRLRPLTAGGAYFGLLVGLLATVAVLAQGRPSVESVPGEWAEVADTLLFELEAPASSQATLEALDAVRRADPGARWHLTSSGALEGLGTAASETSECDCVVGTVWSPMTRLWAQRHSVSPGFFADVGIRVVQGREFTEEDGPDGEGVVIIEADHLRAYTGVSPIGKRIRVSGEGFGGEWYRIIGIVDVPKPKDLATTNRAIPGIYLSALQHPPSRGQLVVPPATADVSAETPPTSGTERPTDVSAESPAVVGTERPGNVSAETPGTGAARGRTNVSAETREAAALAAIARAGVTATPLGRLGERLAMWARPILWFALLVAIVAVSAFVVAVYGVTTLTSLNVAARTSEFGVRRAVGARRRDVRRLVLRELAEVAAMGVVFGSIIGRGLTEGLAYQYAAVEKVGLATLAGVAALLAVAALIAARRPMRRAVAITPIEAIGDVR